MGARSIVLGMLGSAALHFSAAWGLGRVPEPQVVAPRKAPDLGGQVLEMSVVNEPLPIVHAAIPEPRAGGLVSVQNLDDAREPTGEQAPEQLAASLLAPSVSVLTLSDSPLNNFAVDQTQRIRTADDRATLESRRATPNPADATYLATATKGHRERRMPSRVDAVPGAHSERGQAAGELDPAARLAGAGPTREQTLQGEPLQAPARGILRGQGARESLSARVAQARPALDRGPAATWTDEVDARVRDNRNSELLSARMQPSWLEASLASGHGLNPEATGGAFEPARRGSGRARPHTPGPGRDGALDTRDARYVRWYLTQRARVRDALVFPRVRLLSLDQGTSIYSVIIERDGQVTVGPKLVRSSGFDDFDAAARDAIEAVLPFAPLPRELAPESERIAVVIPVEFSNPIVR